MSGLLVDASAGEMGQSTVTSHDTRREPAVLTRLHLSQFRRHEDTDLVFSPDRQLVLISGSNGSGKSTIIESVLYALYGEGRNGRRHLDALVRRGGELEGMQVDLSFTLGDDTYRVVRRRDTKASSAVLYGNEIPLVEGAREVTSEIERILGMDAAGFRLAVVAQQKELDGLASLQPARRAEQLSRLLRLDRITQARDQARSQFRLARERTVALSGGEDLGTLVAAISGSENDVKASTEALNTTRAAVVEADASLAASGGIEAAWQEATKLMARAEGAFANAGSEVERLRAELSAMILPAEVVASAVSLEDIGREAERLERRIAKGEAAEQIVAQRVMVAKELERVQARFAIVDAELAGGGIGALEHELQALDAQRQANDDTRRALEVELQRLVENGAGTKARMELLVTTREEFSQLGSVCQSCGQPVSEEHREQHLEEINVELAVVREEHDALAGAHQRVRLELERLAGSHLEADQKTQALSQRRGQLVGFSTERVELERRRDTYRDQLERLVAPVEDMEELYAQRGALTASIALAREAEERGRARLVVLDRHATLSDALAAATARADRSALELEQAKVDADLETAYRNRQELVAQRDEEMQMVTGLMVQLAVARERLESARSAVKRRESQLEARGRHEHDAVVASNAAKLLGDVEEVLAQQIRPALEGSISEMVSLLSDGRFDQVRVDEDYNLLVRDDESLRPLSELSGGEIDLIALATRLALANVVAERHGTGGPGFLILDECFGSQDPARRESILTALRGLRGAYGQLLLISHVGGLEDAADEVVELSLDESREHLTVTIS